MASSSLIEDFILIWRDKKQSILYKKFYDEISKEKEEIDKLNNHEIWDKMKKIGNPYELIYTTYHRKRKNDSISKYIPLSRSYFKMWEIYHHYPIFRNFPLDTPFHCAHLAEGPGGFMEASYNYLQYIRREQNVKISNQDIYEGITLKPHNEHVPDWTKIKKIFGEDSKVRVNYGNLYIYEDVCQYVKKFENKRAHIVTADGGFDYSSDFNGQELNSCQIIYSEIAIALYILEKSGTFICKVFDIFSVTMVRMIELLHRTFETVEIYKPETSRPANSEKYLICMNYRDTLSIEDKSKILYQIKVWNDMVNACDDSFKSSHFMDMDGVRVQSSVIYMLENYNRDYLENQKKYLKKTIQIAKSNPSAMIEKEDYENILRTQVQNAYQWCKKYHIPINTESMYWKKYGHGHTYGYGNFYK